MTTEIAPWLNIVDELELAPGVSGALAAGDDGEPFVPAMDPVIGLDHRGRVHVVGGFALSSLDDVEVEASAHDISPGDEALADAIRQELREDASTTALDISVEVHDGVVVLLGSVAGPEDADAAETIAARVPGVQELIDLLEVEAFSMPVRRPLP
jgi:hypothetical protein